MKTSLLCLALLLATVSAVAWSQESPETRSDVHSPPFVGLSSPVPQGYSLDLATSYPTFTELNSPVFLHVGLGLSSALQLTFTNEPVVANMIGRAKPLNAWGAKFQILPVRGEFPSVLLWIRGSIGWASEFLGPNDIQGNLPPEATNGLSLVQYEYHTSSAGVAVRPTLGKVLNLDVSIGLLELRWGNLWMMTDRSYHASGYDRALMFDMSAAASIRVLSSLAVQGEVGTFPYLNPNAIVPGLEPLQAYSGAVGIRYFLPINLQADAYLRWQSSFNGVSRKEFRVGLSSLVSLG